MPHRHKHEDEKRAFTHGSSGATADMASDPKNGLKEQRSIETPDSRPAKRLEKTEKPDQLADREADAEDRQEALLDEAIEETFPGSDPIAPKHIT